MQNKQIIRFLQSLVFIPILSTGLTFTPNITNVSSGTVDIQTEQSNKTDSAIKILDLVDDTAEGLSIAEQGEKIDAYFKRHGLPLKGYGLKMAEVADVYGLDWRIIPSVAMRESTGGKFACKSVPNNPFGWGSCKIGFKSMDEAIETIGKNLAGKNKVTAQHYDGDLKENLGNYNGHAVPHYAEEVIAIMNKISPEA